MSLRALFSLGKSRKALVDMYAFRIFAAMIKEEQELFFVVEGVADYVPTRAAINSAVKAVAQRVADNGELTWATDAVIQNSFLNEAMKLAYSEILPQIGEQIRQHHYTSIIRTLQNTYMKKVRSGIEADIYPDKKLIIEIMKKEIAELLPYLKDE